MWGGGGGGGGEIERRNIVSISAGAPIDQLAPLPYPSSVVDEGVFWFIIIGI